MKKTFGKLISLALSLAMAAAAFVQAPAGAAADDPILAGSTFKVSFNSWHEGMEKSDGRMFDVEYNPKTGISSPSGGSVLGNMWGQDVGKKIIYDFSKFADTAELIKAVKVTVQGYTRDFEKKGLTQQDIDTGAYDYWLQFPGDAEGTFRAYDDKVLTLFGPTAVYPGAESLADMDAVRGEDNVWVTNTAVIEDEAREGDPGMTAYRYDYTEEQMEKLGQGSRVDPVVYVQDADITEYVKTQLAQGNNLVAYMLWQDPADTLYVTTECRSTEVTVSYYTEAEFLENIQTTENIGAYIQFLLDETEYAKYEALADRSTIDQAARAGGYDTLDALREAIREAIDAIADTEMLTQIQAAIAAENWTAVDGYIAEALGTQSAEYAQFQGFNNKSYVYGQLKAAEINSYSQFVSAAKAAIQSYTGENLLPEDIYTNVVTQTVMRDTYIRQIVKTGEQTYTIAGVLGTEWGNLNVLKVKFDARSIQYPQMIKSAKVRFNAQNRQSNNPTTGQAYMFATDVINSADASAEILEGDQRFYSNTYDTGVQQSFDIQIDITPDLVERVAAGQQTLAYIMRNALDNGTGGFDDQNGSKKFDLTVTYVNDYDFVRRITPETMADAIGYACGGQTLAIYNALQDKSAVAAQAEYTSIADFAAKVGPAVEAAYLAEINQTGEETVISQAIQAVLGADSDVYGQYAGFASKTAVTSQLTGRNFASIADFAAAAEAAIAQYAEAPDKIDEASKTIDVFRADTLSTDFAYLYEQTVKYPEPDQQVTDLAQLQATNPRSHDKTIIGPTSAMKFAFENLEVPMADFIQSADLNMICWTGSGDVGGKDNAAKAYLVRTEQADGLIPSEEKTAAYDYYDTAALEWNDAGTTADFTLHFDITEDVKAMGDTGSLYYMLYRDYLHNADFVNMRLRGNVGITVEYVNNAELFSRYQQADQAGKAEAVEAYIYINDLFAADTAENIAAALAQYPINTVEEFEAAIENFAVDPVVTSGLSAAKSEGKITGSVTVENKTGAEKSVFLTAAVYGADNQMLACQTYGADTITETDVFDFAFDCPDGVCVRVFCWADEETIQPYCGYLETTVD